MTKALLCLSLLLAAPAFAQGDSDGAPEKLKLLVLDLKTTAVDDETAKLVAELMAVSLSQYQALEVFSGADVKRMIELEADKLATGCEDDSSCIADIAGALGARYVIYGRLGKLGSRIICTLNLFDADEGKAVTRKDIKAKDLDALGDDLEVTLNGLVAPLVGGEKIANSTTKSTVKAEPKEVKRDVPKARDTENELAFKLFLIGGGAAVAAAAYAGSALAGLIATSFSGDPLANMLYLPVLGAGLYGLVIEAQIGTGGALAGACLACSAVQLAGIGAAIAGAFMGGPDEGPAKKVELRPTGPPLVAAAVPY